MYSLVLSVGEPQLKEGGFTWNSSRACLGSSRSKTDSGSRAAGEGGRGRAGPRKGGRKG